MCNGPLPMVRAMTKISENKRVSNKETRNYKVKEVKIIKKKEKPPPGLLLLEALGSNRALCADSLVKKIQRLKVIDEFEVMRNISDTEIIEKGNKEKQLVLLYLQRTKQPIVPYVIQLNMQKNSLHMHCVAALEFSVFVTPDNCPQPFNVHLNPKKLKIRPNGSRTS